MELDDFNKQPTEWERAPAIHMTESCLVYTKTLVNKTLGK